MTTITAMNEISTIPNPDLEILQGNKSRLTDADSRRRGFHNLCKLARYSISLRAARVMPLEKRIDLRIAEMEAVRFLTALPPFSAMVVVRGQHVLFERYAADFGEDHPHSVQSISKTTMNLIVGRLVEQGVLDLSHTVDRYIPEIGSGYTRATLQQVLNMDVVNDYREDFNDPQSTYYLHEEAMGWRLPLDPQREVTQRDFLVRITSPDITNRTGHPQYKDANPDILAWVVERASGRPLRAFLADIVDGAGLEGALQITTDREGVPSVDGGVCLTARDLARYMSIFVRRGRGVGGEMVGSAGFIEQTLSGGVPLQPPADSSRRYCNNMCFYSDRILGHGGWGGQCALANLDTGTVAVFLSVLEDEHAGGIGSNYMQSVINMLVPVTKVNPLC